MRLFLSVRPSVHDVFIYHPRSWHPCYYVRLSISGFTDEHHDFLYHLYQTLPTRPLEGGDVDEFMRATGIKISQTFVSNWFNSGPFKGNMRKTSKFLAKHSPENVQRMAEYIQFMRSIQDHRRVVFADEKSMQEIDIYGTVRSDPRTGFVPNHSCNANSKNRYNIFAAVTIKHDVNPVEYFFGDEHGTSFVFTEFVFHLLRRGTLRRGDIFVVDNCTGTIQFTGECKFLQELLWEIHGIRMVPLLAYCPELNPTELVFRTLVERLKANLARTRSNTNADFQLEVERILQEITHRDTYSYFTTCGLARDLASHFYSY